MLYDPCQRRCHTHVHRLSIQLTFFVFQKTLGTQINSKFFCKVVVCQMVPFFVGSQHLLTTLELIYARNGILC